VECFRLNRALMEFDEAAAHCDEVEGGGVLTTVYSEGQHDAVLTLAQRLAPPAGNAVWIGLQLEGPPSGSNQGASSWAWTERDRKMREGNFSRWAPGEPDGRGWIDPWLQGVVSQDLWWVGEGGGSGDSATGGGMGVDGWRAGEWEKAGVQCGSPPPGAMQSGGAVVEGELFVFGGVDSAARLSDIVTVLRPLTAAQLAAPPVVTGLLPVGTRLAYCKQ
jgi:hypothetical protein